MTELVKRKKTRLRNIILIIFVLLAIYATAIEPRLVETVQREVALTRLPRELDGFTVLQLTDIHYTRRTDRRFIERMIKRANRLQPDVIVLTGDFVTRSAGDIQPCAEVLSKLHARYGVFAVLGNHDYWTDPQHVTDVLIENGIRVLCNEAIPLKQNGKLLWVAGLDDAWSGNPDIAHALRAVPADDAKILLVHEPDYADMVAEYPVDLQLSGHSHGGQVRLPLLGPPVLPTMCRKYPMGYYRIGKLQLYTNRAIGGISIVGIPMRFNCRPEIAVFTLRADK